MVQGLLQPANSNYVYQKILPFSNYRDHKGRPMGHILRQANHVYIFTEYSIRSISRVYLQIHQSYISSPGFVTKALNLFLF
jgi:hypothetical protein